jgi:hypothetical protein
MQFPLADRAKIEVLRALPDQVLMDAFDYFGSSSPDLRLYFSSLYSHYREGTPLRKDMGLVVFRPLDNYPEKPTVRTNASPQFAELLQLESTMLRDNTQWRECVLRMEKILSDMISTNALSGEDFSPPYYAALATRFAIGAGDYAVALRTLRLGFVFVQGDGHLEFLSRVLDRLVDPEWLKRKDQPGAVQPALRPAEKPTARRTSPAGPPPG